MEQMCSFLTFMAGLGEAMGSYSLTAATFHSVAFSNQFQFGLGKKLILEDADSEIQIGFKNFDDQLDFWIFLTWLDFR